MATSLYVQLSLCYSHVCKGTSVTCTNRSSSNKIPRHTQGTGLHRNRKIYRRAHNVYIRISTVVYLLVLILTAGVYLKLCQT